jgi:hypothetical protein
VSEDEFAVVDADGMADFIVFMLEDHPGWRVKRDGEENRVVVETKDGVFHLEVKHLGG